MRLKLLLFLLVPLTHCTPENDGVAPTILQYRAFTSYSDFKQTLLSLASITDEAERNELLTTFWDSLAANNQVPFTFADSVAFLYRGNETSVKWVGDFNGWSVGSSSFAGSKLGESDVWILEKKFPSDARLDYKIVTGSTWLLDPANTYVQYSGFGPNSELRMPDWEYPQETIFQSGINRGVLSENFIIASSNLGYDVQYRVYTPHNYESLSSLPIMYVTDGHEYADDKLGAMVIVLDNLINEGVIEPLIAVFIDPRNPSNLSQNRRADQYTGKINFTNFVADELVTKVDADFKTNAVASARAILGTSLGGWNSAYFGRMRADVFGLIGIHSPAFDANIINSFSSSALLPLKIYMSTGVINDTEVRARNMKSIFEQKGYLYQYKEVNEGHSWGNWRARLKDPLVYFFGK